jgi:hypothetical protein
MPHTQEGPSANTPGRGRGPSVLDLAGLAPDLRRVLRWVMRTGECTHLDLRRSLPAQPEAERLSPASSRR